MRGTQSFVHTLSACWQRPSLTALEVLWRWAYGIPALAVVWWQFARIWQATPVDVAALGRMSLFDPMAAVGTLAQAVAVLRAPVLAVAMWLVPLLAALWVVASAVGRGAVLRRADKALDRRTGTLMVLGLARMAALTASFAVWLGCLQVAARVAIAAPMAAGGEPNLVLYSALVIVTTLALFTLWSVMSWVLSFAPLEAMQRDLGPAASLRAALHTGPLRSKLIEINLVMGIVKIALIVLAMVLSACPLPFESVATPAFMLRWYAGVSVLYFIGSDFFHVVHLVAYLELRKAYAGEAAPVKVT